MASYGISGNTLNIELNEPDERVSIFSDGASYRLSLSTAANLAWTGTADGASVEGANLTLGDLSAFDTVNITDTQANASVYFEAGGAGVFSDHFDIWLDNLSNAVVFNGTTSFAGGNRLSVTVDSRVEVPSGRSVVMAEGDLTMSINTQLPPRVLPFSGLMVNNGTIATTGAGQTSITARGGTGSESAHLNKGVAVIHGGKILGGTTGTMCVTGYGFVGVDGNVQGQGVLVHNAGGAPTSIISSIGANVWVTGYGANSTLQTANPFVNSGVVVGGPGLTDGSQGGMISSGGDGAVTVTGFGGSLVNQTAARDAAAIGVTVVGSNATIRSGGAGLVTVNGTGGGAPATTNCGVGIYVSDGIITSGPGGSVSVTGTGSTSRSGFNRGVWLTGVTGGVRIAAGLGNGSTSVSGTGGTNVTSGVGGDGVIVANGSMITALGSGDVNVTGYGHTNTTSGAGVSLMTNGTITTSGGNVEVTGYGGGRQNVSNSTGVSLLTGGTVSATGSGKVTVTGFGGSNNPGGGSLNHGVIVQACSTNASIPGRIISGGGDILVRGTGGGGDPNAPTTQTMVSQNRGVSIQTGGYIQAGGSGNVTVVGTAGGRSPDQVGNRLVGVYVSGTNHTTATDLAGASFSCISSSGGSVQVTGYGGGAFGTNFANTCFGNHGVEVENGGRIASGADGDLYVNGKAGGNGSPQRPCNLSVGVLVRNNCLTVPSMIRSAGNGGVTVIGQSGGTGLSRNNAGVCITSGAMIGSAGLGDITIDGKAGADAGGQSNSGVIVERGAAGTPLRASILSGGGNITITGTGGTNGDAYNVGVGISLGGLVSAGGNGAVNITGRGGNVDGNQWIATLPDGNHGVTVIGTAESSGGKLYATVTSQNGPVSITGYGGQTNNAVTSASKANYGVLVSTGGRILGSGSFPVQVTGFGGGLGTGNQGDNFGVAIQNSDGLPAEISSTGGPVTVIGSGGGTGGSGTTNHGVLIHSGGRIGSATHAVAVNVIGIGGGNQAHAAATNHGIAVTGCETTNYLTIISNNGPITITGTPGGGSNSQGFEGSASVPSVIGLAAAPGNVTIITDSMSLSTSPGSAVHAANHLTVMPLSPGVGIALGNGSSNPSGPLSISPSELATFNAPTIRLGGTATGNISIDAQCDVPAGSNLTLSSHGTASALFASLTSADAVTNGLTIAPGKTLDLSTVPSIAATINNATLGSGYSQLKVTGDLSIAGKTLSLSGNYVASIGEVFTIVEATNLRGNFAGLPQGSTVSFNGRTLIVNYTTTSVTLTAISQLVGIQVSRGQSQRSYLRFIDLTMGSDSIATRLASESATRMRLIRSNLNGGNPTQMSLTGLVSASGTAVTIDFGWQGIGGARNTNLADGYYALQLDLDGDGAFETEYNFFRLFGDTNGDGKVDQTDITNVMAGMSAYSAEYDTNFDGRVNSTDLVYVRRAVNRMLDPSLPLGLGGH